MAGGKAPSRCWLLKPGAYSTHRKFCSLLKASHHRHLNKNIEIYIPTCNSFSTHQKPFINQKQNMVLVSMAFLRVACFLFQNLLSGMIFKRAPALMTASWPSIGNNNSPEDWSERSRGSWRMGRWHVHGGTILLPPIEKLRRPLKMDGWKMKFLLTWSPPWGDFLNFRGGGRGQFLHIFTPGLDVTSTGSIEASLCPKITPWGHQTERYHH